MAGPSIPNKDCWIARVFLAVLLATTLSGTAGCHNLGDVKVASLDFGGNHAFRSDQLRNILATRQSGWLPWAPKHYFNRAEFDADIKRVLAFYSDRGYPAARIAGVHVDLNAAGDSVRLRIDIDEGQPTLVDQVRFEGFDPLPEDVRSSLPSVPLQQGAPLDRDRVRASRDMVEGLLRDNGYPLAHVDAGERPADTAGRVLITFRADPGPLMHFGEVSVAGLEQVHDGVVRREVAFKPADLFRQSQILRTQRRLSSLEVFDLANVTPRVDDADGGSVPVRITVAEGLPRRLKFGIGYGSEERARGTAEWRHLNFFGGARQATVEAKASYLDQGLKLHVVEPYFFRPGLSLSVSGIVWNSRQMTYDSQTYGGRTTLSYHVDSAVLTGREPTHYEFRVVYIHEYLKYGISAESLGDLSLREERIGLGLDPDTGRSAGTIGSVAFEAERVAVDIPFDPHKGLITAVRLEHAAPWLAGTYNFTEISLEQRVYIPVGDRVVLAAHGRVASIGAANAANVPFAKRYFLGGSTSLRGWGRFQVSPLDAQGFPIGGRTLVEVSTEVRFPVSGRIGAVAFVDGGSVGSTDFAVERLRFRWDTGAGLRYATPIGAIRADVGFQLTPIEGLLINGQAQPRRWRIHFSIGQTF